MELASEAEERRVEHMILTQVKEVVEKIKKETMEFVSNAVMEMQNTACEQTKLDKIERYLHMLYEAQKVDHAVHQEIDQALKQFKQESGI